MFGKTKDAIDEDFTGVFGDEVAADRDAQMDELRDRVGHVEAQIQSQFTSMAAYAQIAQEQVELARAESQSHGERTENRLTQLIERERAERLGTNPTASSAAIPPHIDARLGAIEDTIEVIKAGMSDCLSRQKALADAIATLFQPADEPAVGRPLPPPTVSGPISGLSLQSSL